MNAIDMLKSTDINVKDRFGVKNIGIFGSFARGEEHSDSDLDVLVDFEEGKKTFDNYMDLKFYLEELFGRKVDLVTVNALRPRLKTAILRETLYA
jgi:predicted nucleotidyltransferase